MPHNERCSNAKESVKYCQCDCKGALHRQVDEAREPLWVKQPMTEAMGGEVAEFIKKYQGKEFACHGVCRKNQIANDFLGYEHDGGLADATGKKWWVYVNFIILCFIFSFLYFFSKRATFKFARVFLITIKYYFVQSLWRFIP